MRVGHGWKERFLPSSAVNQWERNTEFCFGASLSLSVDRTSTGDSCLFLLEPRASDSKPVRRKSEKSKEKKHFLRKKRKTNWNLKNAASETQNEMVVVLQLNQVKNKLLSVAI